MSFSQWLEWRLEKSLQNASDPWPHTLGVTDFFDIFPMELLGTAHTTPVDIFIPSAPYHSWEYVVYFLDAVFTPLLVALIELPAWALHTAKYGIGAIGRLIGLMLASFVMVIYCFNPIVINEGVLGLMVASLPVSFIVCLIIYPEFRTVFAAALLDVVLAALSAGTAAALVVKSALHLIALPVLSVAATVQLSQKWASGDVFEDHAHAIDRERNEGRVIARRDTIAEKIARVEAEILRIQRAKPHWPNTYNQILEAQGEEIEVPERYEDRYMYTIMEVPVTFNGHHYDGALLLRQLRTGRDYHNTRLSEDNFNLAVNHELNREIDTFMRAYVEKREASVEQREPVVSVVVAPAA